VLIIQILRKFQFLDIVIFLWYFIFRNIITTNYKILKIIYSMFILKK